MTTASECPFTLGSKILSSGQHEGEIVALRVVSFPRIGLDGLLAMYIRVLPSNEIPIDTEVLSNTVYLVEYPDKPPDFYYTARAQIRL